MPEIHIPTPTPDDIAAMSEHLNRLHNPSANGHEAVLDSLREMWRIQGQLAYPDFRLLWEIVDHMQSELTTYREMDLEGREEYD